MPEQISFDANFLVATAGAILSMLFTYIPKFNAWFAMKADEFKQLTMLGLMLLITGAVFGLGCGGFIDVGGFACNKTTVVHFIYTFIIAMSSNQATYLVSPKPLAVKQANDIILEDELYQKDKLAG